MSKEIKCKKCGLTYSKKNRECPYCHKKRTKTYPIIIIAIIAVAVGVLIACGNLLNPKVKYIDGLKIELTNVTENAGISNITGNCIITLDLELTNTSSTEKSIDFDFVTYADDYLIENSWLFGGRIMGVDGLIAGKKYSHQITINPNADWKKIEIYYKDSNNKNKDSYEKLFVITNDKE